MKKKEKQRVSKELVIEELGLRLQIYSIIIHKSYISEEYRYLPSKLDTSLKRSGGNHNQSNGSYTLLQKQKGLEHIHVCELGLNNNNGRSSKLTIILGAVH